MEYKHPEYDTDQDITACNRGTQHNPFCKTRKEYKLIDYDINTTD